MAGSALNEVMCKTHIIDPFVRGGFGVVRARRLVQQAVDRCRHKLDVPDLLCGDARDQLIEGPQLLLLLKRDRLVQIVIKR